MKYKLFTHKYRYIHLHVSKQLTDVKLLLFYSNTWNLLILQRMIDSELNHPC